MNSQAAIDVFALLVSFKNNPSKVFLVLKTVFIKFWKNYKDSIVSDTERNSKAK